MNIITNVNTLSKGIGGLTSLYAAYQIGTIGKQIISSKHQAKTLQNNLVPLIHASLGLSLGSLGAGLADLSLASGGALHLISQQLTNGFFDYQNKQRQKDVSKAVQKLQKNVFIGSCCITSALNETKHTNAEKIQIFKDLSTKRLNAYINSIKDELDEDTKTNQAKQIFDKLEYIAKDSSEEAIQTSKLTTDEKNIYNKIKTDFPDNSFNTHISSEQLSHIKGESYTAIYTPSTQAIPVTGEIINIIKLNKGVKFENVPIGSKITSQYGAYLNKDDTITVNNNNVNGQQEDTTLKKGDTIHKDSFVQTTDDCTYIVQIAPDEATAETNHFLYKNNALEDMQQQQNHFHWDLSTMLATASLVALVGTVALGTPMLSSEMKINTLTSLGKAVKWGATFAGALMPCGINAANMRGHIANNLQKNKNIIIKTPELLDKLADMKIGEKNSDYHFLVDFNGTLTQGSEFASLKVPTSLVQDNHEESNKNLSWLPVFVQSFLPSFNTLESNKLESKKESLASSKEVDNTEISKILKPIVAMGNAKESTHHIHVALKKKLEDMNEDMNNESNSTDANIDTSKIKILDGMGTYYRDDEKQYAIGNESLIEKFLGKLPNDKKTTLTEKFDILKEQKSENAVTYIIHNDDIYALETTHKLRDDAKAFLEQHAGHFTILTGAKLSDTVKKELKLSKDNCHEELIPEEKKRFAETLSVNGTKIPKEKIVAFGDGGNDWGMFHTVNVATQLGDIKDTKHDDDTSEEQKDKKHPNFAEVFSDVIIPNLSDFDILNKIAKKQRTPQRVLNGLGVGVMAWGASMALSHAHHHNPLHHTIHHLGSIVGFYGLGALVTKFWVMQG